MFDAIDQLPIAPGLGLDLAHIVASTNLAASTGLSRALSTNLQDRAHQNLGVAHDVCFVRYPRNRLKLLEVCLTMLRELPDTIVSRDDRHQRFQQMLHHVPSYLWRETGIPQDQLVFLFDETYLQMLRSAKDLPPTSDLIAWHDELLNTKLTLKLSDEDVPVGLFLPRSVHYLREICRQDISRFLVDRAAWTLGDELKVMIYDSLCTARDLTRDNKRSMEEVWQPFDASRVLRPNPLRSNRTCCAVDDIHFQRTDAFLWSTRERAYVQYHPCFWGRIEGEITLPKFVQVPAQHELVYVRCGGPISEYTFGKHEFRTLFFRFGRDQLFEVISREASW